MVAAVPVLEDRLSQRTSRHDSFVDADQDRIRYARKLHGDTNPVKASCTVVERIYLDIMASLDPESLSEDGLWTAASEVII
jgi:hypothetical protein